MLRNRLRTLEQQINATDLPEDVKVKLQGYVTGCYGSLTSFNVLFAEEDDQFRGGGGGERAAASAGRVFRLKAEATSAQFAGSAMRQASPMPSAFSRSERFSGA